MGVIGLRKKDAERCLSFIEVCCSDRTLGTLRKRAEEMDKVAKIEHVIEQMQGLRDYMRICVSSELDPVEIPKRYEEIYADLHSAYMEYTMREVVSDFIKPKPFPDPKPYNTDN